jgi:uncharacterized repeat protein (TIGR01451 family)
VSLHQKPHQTFVRRATQVVLITLIWLVVALGLAYAVEIPGGSANASLQTTGPNAGINIGDYYTNNNGGVLNGEPQRHIFDITIPCAWPSNRPITVALFDPEATGAIFAGPPFAVDEQRGGADDLTNFTLRAPDGIVISTDYDPADGTHGLWVELATFTPGTAGFGCGLYVLETTVADNDDNGWRLQVSHDPDCDVSPGVCTGIGPAISAVLDDGDEEDDGDGIAGSGDEIVIGLLQASFEHAVTSCQDFFFFVDSTPVILNNFDMDDTAATNHTVTYFPPPGSQYAPSQPGTASPGNQWNNSANGAPPPRSGDTFAIGPTDIGWWRASVCLNDDNQYIFEGEEGEPIYFEQPGAPLMTLSKDNGVSIVAPNEVLTYTINFANIADTVPEPPPPGAALNVTITDNLPANAAFQNCIINPPYTGACAEGPAGVVTAQLNEVIAAGEGGSIQIVVRLNPDAGGTVSNSVQLDYQDSLGNQYPPPTAQDVDLIPPDLSLAKTDGGVSAAPGGTVVFTLTYTNSSATGATGVVITETVPANTTFNAGASLPTPWSCPDGSGPGATCLANLGPVAGNSSGSVNFALTLDDPLPNGVTQIANSAVIGDDGANGPDPTPNNTANETTPISGVQPRIVDPLITKQVDLSQAQPGDLVNYSITIFNPGPPSNASATGVTLTDALPLELNFVSQSVSSTPAGLVSGVTVTTTLVSLSGHPSGITQTLASTVTVYVPALGVNEEVTLNIAARVNGLANPLPANILNVAALAFNEGTPRTAETLVVAPASPPQAPPSANRNDNDDDDDDSDPPAPAPSAGQTAGVASPTPTPAPPLPVLLLPETGYKTAFQIDSAGLKISGALLALLGAVTGLFVWRRLKP